jgi:hypothetical protein
VLGHVNRAESIAGSISNPQYRAHALTSVAKVSLRIGDSVRAHELFTAAETAAREIFQPELRVAALARIMERDDQKSASGNVLAGVTAVTAGIIYAYSAVGDGRGALLVSGVSPMLWNERLRCLR